MQHTIIHTQPTTAQPHPRQGCTYPQHPTQAADLVSLLQGDGASTSKNTVVIYEDARQVTDNDWLRFYYRSGLPNVTGMLYCYYGTVLCYYLCC